MRDVQGGLDWEEVHVLAGHDRYRETFREMIHKLEAVGACEDKFHNLAFELFNDPMFL